MKETKCIALEINLVVVTFNWVPRTDANLETRENQEFSPRLLKMVEPGKEGTGGCFIQENFSKPSAIF